MKSRQGSCQFPPVRSGRRKAAPAASSITASSFEMTSRKTGDLIMWADLAHVLCLLEKIPIYQIDNVEQNGPCKDSFRAISAHEPILHRAVKSRSFRD